MKTEIKAIVSVMIVFGVIIGCFSILNIFSSGITVANETFGFQASKDKYEWFKMTSESLRAKKANIQSHKAKIEDMENDYKGTPRTKWDRVDKQNMALWRTEYQGMIASYNNLVGEYNTASKSFTWNFAKSKEVPRTFELIVD